MKKEEKKKTKGGKEGVFIPPGSGVALAWGVLGCPSGHPPFLNFPSTTTCSMSLTHLLRLM